MFLVVKYHIRLPQGGDDGDMNYGDIVELETKSIERQ